MQIKQNLHKILSVGGAITALGLSSQSDKLKSDTEKTMLHPKDPYSAKALRFNEEEQMIIEPLIFLKNGSAKQFVGLLIKGIANNKEAEFPIYVYDLIKDAEKLLKPQAQTFVQKHPGNIMYQENLDDLNTIVNLYKKVYKRTAKEDAMGLIVKKSKPHFSKSHDQRT